VSATAVFALRIRALHEERILSLLRSAAAGESAAFDELYNRYAGLLYGLLLRILGNADDAQDILQDTFVQAFNNVHRYDPARGSEAAWLIAMARSRGIDRLRARRVRSERESDAGAEISRTASSVVSGGEAMLQSEQRRNIRGALASLPEAQRMALELAYFEGLSQSEIARRLGEPLGTIKTRMQLGMKKLREHLKETR
jgi:RNA polymerase sigma-70 factor (ECF subfamily)